MSAANKIPSPKLKPSENPALERFLRYCHYHNYAAKSAIIRPGDPADTLYYIVKGSATIVLEDDDGREMILGYLNPGDFIGEMGLFVEQETRQVLVRTKTDCQVAAISYIQMKQLSKGELKEDYPEVLHALATHMATRLLQTSRKVERLAFLDVAGRVARTILDLCQEPDAMTHPEGMQIKVTRTELARIVGATREMVGRVVKDMENDGMIRVKGKTIVVLGTR